MLTLAPVIAPARAGKTNLSELLSRRYAKRTAMLWILWFGVVLTYYGMFLWIPSLLVTRGFDDVRPGQANMLFFLSTFAQVPGYFSAAWLVERWGRKPTLVLYLLGTAVSAFMFGNVGAEYFPKRWLGLFVETGGKGFFVNQGFVVDARFVLAAGVRARLP